MTAMITDIDYDRGIISLLDGSTWQVDPSFIATIATWLPAHSATVTQSGTSQRMHNNDNGATVCAVRAD